MSLETMSLKAISLKTMSLKTMSLKTVSLKTRIRIWLTHHMHLPPLGRLPMAETETMGINFVRK